ncbi:hypothetical protein [Flavobacterium cerinum]|uniref:DUF4890 domain-containing protein n=1 Tax=Flavobacterium cerinum TaxID=2502784 RepID=A0ABY5IS99_9FLAO|nr:hypothetical protein [Flavobacterium cerinum]UUC45670.1 hypothetical protein NOX80_00305 [Flavobacterium cerinum]
MKRLVLAVCLLATMAGFAQEQGSRGGRERLAPEQQVQLQVKKMTLDLDLTAKQQKEVEKLLLDQSKKREEARAAQGDVRKNYKDMTSDERFALQNKRMDDKIAFKGEMKKILNSGQMEKWEKQGQMRQEKITKRGRNLKNNATE